MRGVETPEKADQLLLPALERPNERNGSRIKIPKSSEHDLTNLVKKFHSQDPRTRKWLRIDSHGQADIVEVTPPPPTPTTQASPTRLPPEATSMLVKFACRCLAPAHDRGCDSVWSSAVMLLSPAA